jgi:MATE family multidrug resistance protein
MHYNLAQMVSGLVDIFPDMTLTSMAGHVSPEKGTLYMSAYSLVSFFQILYIDGIANGLGAAVDTYCSHAYGASNFREMWLTCQAAWIIFVATLPVGVLVVLNGAPILKLLGQNPEIADVAGNIMVLLVLTLPLEFLFSVLKSALQAQNVTSPFTVSSLLGWVASCSVTYVLLFRYPIGYMAIAVANPIFWAGKVIGVLPALFSNNLFRDHWPGWRFAEARQRVPKLLRLGSSSFLMVTSQVLGTLSITLLSGLFPNASVMIAANSIFAWLVNISFMPLLGLCVAGAIRVGNALGSGRPRRAQLAASVAVTSSIFVGSVILVASILSASKFPFAFTSNADAVREATSVIRKVIFLVPILALQLGLQALYRACGRQFACGQLNFACLCVVGVPLGVLFATKAGEGIAGLWLGYTAGLALFSVLGVWWWTCIDWAATAHKATLAARQHRH